MRLFRPIFAALALMLIATSAPAQQLTCNQNVQYDGGAATTLLFTAPAGPRVMYICGYTINAGAAATNVQFKYGTGPTCAGGTPGNLTPNFVLPVAGQVFDDAGIWHGLQMPTGNNLCVVTTGASTQIVLYYTFQ